MENIPAGRILVVFIVAVLVLPVVSVTDHTSQSQDTIMTPSGDIPHTPITISSDADFQTQASTESWSGNGSASNPYRIEDYVIEVSSSSCGMRIKDAVTVHYTIDNCTVYGTADNVNGIVMNGGNGTVINCEVYDVKNGIRAYNINKTIRNNSVRDFDGYAIELNGAVNAEVSGNVITGKSNDLFDPLYLVGVLIVYGANCGNTVYNNSVSNCDLGISSSANDSAFIKNNITQCGDGIVLFGDRNTVANNTVMFNTRSGIWLMSNAHHNNVYYNHILNNTQNAEDDGSDNRWHDGVSLGNFWNDGFGIFYSIPGDAGSMDRYPRYIESIPPYVEDNTEITLVFGSAFTTIVWDVEDHTPDQFWVYVNESLFRSGSWHGNTISVDFASLGVGDYNVTMVVGDRNDNTSSDQLVLHIVQPTTTTGTETTTTTDTDHAIMIVGIAAVGVMVLVIIIAVFRKQ